MARPLLSLVAILKDETKSVRALLESVQGVVDHATILDTGSTDGTQDIVREVADRCIGSEYGSCRLFEEPFIAFDKITDRQVIDFAKTRNRVLELEESRDDAAVFTLMLSGDEVLVGGAQLRAFLESKDTPQLMGAQDKTDDAFCVMMHSGSSTWQFPRVLRTGAGRRYVNPIHEVPVGKNGETGGQLIPGVTVIHDATDKARLYRRMKTVDLPVLTHIAESPVATHEEHAARARALLNLAMTHEQLAGEYQRDPGNPWLMHQMIAMSYYWRRSELEGDPEDVNYALFHYLNIANVVGLYNSEEYVARLGPLVQIDERRPELRYLLAHHSAFVDPRQGAFLALEAVRVAREARENPLKLPTDVNIEWMAYRLAAECARVLEKPARVREMAEKGIAAGGPQEAFADYLAL